MAKKLLILLIPMLIGYSQLWAQLTYVWEQTVPVLIEENPLQLPWAGGINSAQINKIDLNGDEVEDLVIFDRTTEKISTFLFSDNQYQYSPEHESLFPEGLKGWMLLRDYDCDGLKDLFTHTPFGIRVFRNVTSFDGSLQWELIQDGIFTEGFTGQINLQVNIVDMPGIADIDGDGDLDILVYDFAVGGGIEYHQNLSVENTGSCGLDYKRITKEWGEFSECICDIFAFGEVTCEDLESGSGSRIKHIGGKTILTYDADNDGDHEVLIGQEDCMPLYYLENVGTSDDALMQEFSMEYPNSDNPVDNFLFPAAYYEDLDGDGIKDLASSTNFPDNHDNELDFQNSLWFYRNTGTNDVPDFQFVKQNYLQGEMLDLGEGANPAFADFDRDGDLDLFISHKGSPVSGQLIGTIWLFENTGSPGTPGFRLFDKDYLGISSLEQSDISIQFVDINKDGNPDLAVKGSSDDNSTELNVFINQGGGMYTFDLGLFTTLSVSLDVGDDFHFYDINKDGLPDLLVGRTTGRLDYLRNTGSDNSPNFSIDTEGFLGIEDDFSRKWLRISIADLNFDGSEDLITIDQQGTPRWYSDFLSKVDQSPAAEEILVEGLEPATRVLHNFGRLASLTTAGMFPEAKPALVFGLQTGGLQILRNSNSSLNPPGDNNDFSVIIYPNPTMGLNNGIVTVTSNEDGIMQVISSTGQEVSQKTSITSGLRTGIDTRTLPNGLYLVKVESITGKVKSLQLVVIN